MGSRKILHILTRVVRGGGAEKSTYLVLKELSQKYDISLVVGKESELYQLKELNKVKIYKLDSLTNSINFFNDLRSLVQLYRLIRKNRYDIVHSHQSKANIIGILAAYLAKTPIVIYHSHGSMANDSDHIFKRYGSLIIENILQRLSDHTIFVGNDLKDRYLQQGITRPNRYSMIRSAIDLTKFRNMVNLPDAIRSKKIELEFSPEQIIIGTVANFESRKGYKYALGVAKKVLKKKPNVKFLFVGQGQQLLEIESEVLKSGLTKSIFLPGFRDDIPEIMNIFDIFILTSLREGLPQVLVQASVLGKPIVSFSVEGSREIISRGKNGFIIDNKNVELMAEKIIFLLDNLERTELIGMRGPKIIDNQWDISVVTEKINNLYEALLN